MASKGQVTNPKAIREQLRLHPGHKLDFLLDEAGGLGLDRLQRPSLS